MSKKMSKKTQDLFIAIGLLLVGYFFGDTVAKVNQYSPVKIPQTVEEVKETKAYKKTTGNNTEAENNIPDISEKNSDLKSGTVKYIIDGDTVILNNGEKVRYVGMDTPERGQCWYRQAKEMNRDLVSGKKIKLETDISNRDKYDRLLRYIYIDDKFVNLELVKAGLARVKVYKPDVKYYDVLKAAEDYAKLNKIGLWGGCEE